MPKSFVVLLPYEQSTAHEKLLQVGTQEYLYVNKDKIIMTTTEKNKFSWYSEESDVSEYYSVLTF